MRARFIISHGVSPAQSDHHVARDGSFLDYVRWSLGTPGVGVVIRNYQVIHLSAASFRFADIQAAEATEVDLAETKALLRGWAAFGIVRAFAESCRLFKSAFGSKFPDLRFVSRHENSSTDQSFTKAEAVDLARAELGASGFRMLVEANRLDLDLYQFACTHFRNRLARLE